MAKEKKFTFAEGLLMLLLCLLADGIEGLVSAIGVIPVITPLSVAIAWALNFFIFGSVQLWLIIKGDKKFWFLAGTILEFIPFLNILPLRSATCAITIYLANNPKISSVVSVATGKMSLDKPLDNISKSATDEFSGLKIKRPPPLPNKNNVEPKS